MGKTTFSGPVKSLGGFNAVGYNCEVTIADGTDNLTLDADTHGGRILYLLDASMAFTLPSIVTTEPTDKTDPNQLCNLGLTFSIYCAIAQTTFTLTTASDDNFVGIYACLHETTNETDHFFADGDDDVMTMNGTTQGGLIDSYIEVTATTRGWLCSKSIPLGSGVLITPFS
tara:strand:- start:133 stop:645 length:513 start_codon:yes stop_codon:yes gene_type:complete